MNPRELYLLEINGDAPGVQKLLKFLRWAQSRPGQLWPAEGG